MPCPYSLAAAPRLRASSLGRFGFRSILVIFDSVAIGANRVHRH